METGAARTAAGAEPPQAAETEPHRSRIWLLRLALIIAIVGAWELSAARGWVDPLFASRPSDIVPAIGDILTTRETLTDLRWTLTEVALGYTLGCGLGIAFGLLLSSSRTLRLAFEPVLTALNAVPRIALVPLLVAWFGIGMLPRVAMAITIVFFVMATAVVAALAHPDRDLMMLAASLGASRRQWLQTFLLPRAVPVVASALELALVYAFLGVIAAEIVSGSNGLGSRLTEEANLFRADRFFATLILLTAVVTALTTVIRVAERRLVAWHAVERLER
jgi:NitT/TauT family transport system permease protein